MLNKTIQNFPQEFNLCIKESIGWIYNVRLILNDNYQNPIPLEWCRSFDTQAGIRYSFFATRCDPENFNLATNCYNSCIFLFCAEGKSYKTEKETFFIQSD